MESIKRNILLNPGPSTTTVHERMVLVDPSWEYFGEGAKRTVDWIEAKLRELQMK